MSLPISPRTPLPGAVRGRESARLARERARAEAAERLAGRRERHSRLLAAVARAAETLLAARDLPRCLDAVLAEIGTTTAADRACLARLEWTPDEPPHRGWQEILHEWTRPGATRQMDTVARRFPMRRDDVTWDRVFQQLATERRVVMRVSEMEEPFRSEQRALGIVWTLCYPVTVEGEPWGLVGFDYASPREAYDEADLCALQTVASAIAHALARERAEDRRLAVERLRADQLATSNGELRRRDALLQAVADITRELLHAPDYRSVLPTCFQKIAEAAGIHRVVLFLEQPLDGGGMAHAVVCEWGAPGVRTHAEHDLMVIPNRVVPSFVAPLHAGRSVWMRMEDFHDEVRPAFLRLAVRSTGCVPIFVSGAYAGAITFDDCVVPRDWSNAEIATLAAAANAVAAALERRDLEARERAAELARTAATQSAVLKERNRIARDLHDTLAQGFTGVLAQLGAAEGAVELGGLAEATPYLERAKALARFSLAEARSSFHALRPETNGGPLVVRLRRMVETMTQGTALDAAVAEAGEPGALGPAADWCVHKFVQEALANAIKHAGARHFRVELAWAAGLFACVSDDGRGFDPATTVPGVGLHSMHERAAEAGGCLVNESTPGYGTRLCLHLPLP